jgi:hypothetical protein
LDELRQNLEEVVGMLLEDGQPALEAEFVGTQLIRVHPGRDISPALLRQIAHDIGMTAEDLIGHR